MARHKQQEQPDRHLEAPAEANRDKHINFLEEQEKSAQRVPSSTRSSGNEPLKSNKRKHSREK